MVQLNLNFTFTLVWHTIFWTISLCHLRVACEQIIKIYIYTHIALESLNKFIGSLANLLGYLQVACEHWTNLLSPLRVACGRMIWCTRKVCYSRGMFYVTRKMQTWLQYLWIRIRLTHIVVYSHCSLSFYPINCRHFFLISAMLQLQTNQRTPTAFYYHPKIKETYISEHLLLTYLISTGAEFKQQSEWCWKMTGCSKQCWYTMWCISCSLIQRCHGHLRILHIM